MMVLGFAACASSRQAAGPAPRTLHAAAAQIDSVATGNVTGRVQNREAGPAPYALVSAIPAEPGTIAPLIQRTRCDEAGRFTFNQLAAGRYAFFAMSAAMQPSFAGSTLPMPVDGTLLVSITLDQPSLLQ